MEDIGGRHGRALLSSPLLSRGSAIPLLWRALSLGSYTQASTPRLSPTPHPEENLVKLTLPLTILATSLSAQQPPGTPQPFFVGNRLGLPINPAADGAFAPMSPNVKVIGAIYSAGSCSYDATRGVIVVPNRGVPQNVQTNNAWISFINHDGSVHTARWIGIQSAGDARALLTPPLVLNEPYGSDIVGGILYLADRDGGTRPDEASVAV